jgi:FAD:protein FMN transferase
MRRAEEIWGTVISIDAQDPVTPEVLHECFVWFRRIDELFSTWRDDSEVMRIGRGELRVEDAAPDVRTVLELSEQMRLESAGAFDIRAGAHADVPSRPGLAPLDPSGIVKGWAVERARTIFERAGVRVFFVNAGGDVTTGAAPDGARGWSVGIQHPWERDKVAAVLEVADTGVATSGRYERGDHVLNPATGRPATGLASVTVVGRDLAIADAYATAAVAMGAPRGMRWLATRAGYAGMGITDDAEVITTPGFDRYRVS